MSDEYEQVGWMTPRGGLHSKTEHHDRAHQWGTGSECFRERCVPVYVKQASEPANGLSELAEIMGLSIAAAMATVMANPDVVLRALPPEAVRDWTLDHAEELHAELARRQAEWRP